MIYQSYWPLWIYSENETGHSHSSLSSSRGLTRKEIAECLYYDDMHWFLDAILIPALKEAMVRQSHLVSASSASERFLQRSARGTYIDQEFHEAFVNNMRMIIDENISDKNFSRFSDFFFVSFSYGTKTVFHQLKASDEETFDLEFERCFSDINWNIIENKALNVVCDFAVNISKMDGRGVVQTGLWLSEDKTGLVSQWSKNLDNLQCSLLHRLGLIDSTNSFSLYMRNIFALSRRHGGSEGSRAIDAILGSIHLITWVPSSSPLDSFACGGCVYNFNFK